MITKLNIPLGSKISASESKTIEIRVPHTKFWVVGEIKTDNLWDAYLIDKQTNYKEILRKNITTKTFTIFSNVILKTPFPYMGKRDNAAVIKKFIKKITKK